MFRARFFWLLAPVLALVLASCYKPAGPTVPGVRSSSNKIAAVGRAAPDIEGTNVDGHTMNLSDFRGKVVLLDFWATY
jgi:hypothetical protein